MDREHFNAPQDAAKRVDEAARLFDEHHVFIRVILEQFLHDPQEEEDVYQDLFIYFVRKPVPEDVILVKSWLYRVILDRVRDRKRRQSRYQKRLKRYAIKHPVLQESVQNPPPDPEQITEIFGLIRKHLTETQARAVLFKYEQQLEVEEIARRMNVKPRTVSRYISIGLGKLRRFLNKDDI